MIKEWLEEYGPRNHEEAESALREIMQEIALAGLSRSGFFEKAAFYAGTAIRIFYGVKRFSEDLDFSLLEPNVDFQLQPYLDGMLNEFNALGIDVTVKEKVKSKQSAIDSALLIEKIEQVSIEDIKEDIVRFIPDDKPLEIWSKDYFRELARRISFQ